MKFGKFRESEAGESTAQYFKAAVFKAAGGKDSSPTSESMIHGFISRTIDRTNGDQLLLEKAYNYAVKQFAAKGDLRLCTDDVFVAEAA